MGLIMSNIFKIYIDRLSSEKTQLIKEEVSPSFLEIDEEDLRFLWPVFLDGDAYIAGDYLIISINVETFFEMPCRICNEKKKYPFHVQSCYITVALDKISQKIYDFSDQLRELILLEVPQFVECNNNHCPKREVIKPYLKKKLEKDKYLPFKDLT